MMKRIYFILKYYLLWLLFFQFSRLIFVLYNYAEIQDSNQAEILGLDWLKMMYYGLKPDCSAAAYLTVFILLFLLFDNLIDSRFFQKVIKGFTVFMLLITTFLIVSDMQIYGYWGFKLDLQPLMYLATPGEASNFIKWEDILLPTIVGIILAGLFWKGYQKLLPNTIPLSNKWGYLLATILMLGLMIIPIRGGIGIIPLNSGDSFFHKHNFVNHATINVPWNVIDAVVNKSRPSNAPAFYSSEKANQIFEGIYKKDEIESLQILKNNRPNIILLIVESYTDKLLGLERDGKKVSPNLDALIEEGIYFENAFSSGDRTDKGLVAILGGYPAQPKISIINMPSKSRDLPSLIKDLKEIDYKVNFYYGGDMSFANMKSYVLSNGPDKMMQDIDFKSDVKQTKWGVHDHVMLEYIAEEYINDKANQVCYMALTLSSHEPFDVPMETVFEGTDAPSKFLNSAHYTDKAIGDFVHKIKASDKWENTLMIVVADHGKRLPDGSQNHAPSKYSIPMLWTGGAIAIQDTVIEKMVSQTDISLSLLKQMGEESAQYRFSQDLFKASKNGFAFYCFKDGFGWLQDSSQYIYNNQAQQTIEALHTDTLLEQQSKSYMQILIEDYDQRGQRN